MITSISLVEYAAFRHSPHFPLSGINILVGRNSSGKSAVLKALLALRQSVEDAPKRTMEHTHLSLRGHMVDLGTFVDVAHQHNSSTEIGFDLTCSVGGEGSLTPSNPLVPVPQEQAHPIEFRVPSGPDESVDLQLQLRFKPIEPYGPTLSSLRCAAKDIGGVNFKRTVGEERTPHWRMYPSGNIPSQSVELDFGEEKVFLPRLRLRRSAKYRAAGPHHKRKARLMVEAYNAAAFSIERDLKQLRALGPLRSPAARRYTFEGYATAETGLDGAAAIDMLILERALRGNGPRPLFEATTQWVKKLGLANSVNFEVVAREAQLYALRVGVTEGAVKGENFADVGFGLSQALPIIVNGLTVPSGSLFAVQQPELHLHPDAQAGMADFFWHLAKSGIRVLIETHSEYMISRFRRRSAETEHGSGPKNEHGADTEGTDPDLTLTYMDQEADRGAIVSQLNPDTFQFDDLPSGFMDEAIRDRIAIMKIRSERGS